MPGKPSVVRDRADQWRGSPAIAVRLGRGSAGRTGRSPPPPLGTRPHRVSLGGDHWAAHEAQIAVSFLRGP
jgi:hypothetical protein